VTNDAFAPVRAPRLAAARSSRPPGAGRPRGGRFGARRRSRGEAPATQGRWSLTAPLLAPAASGDPSARRRALAELLLERYGVLTREQVLADGVPGAFAGIYSELTQLETLGIARRGYFVEGLGGAQFALPGAVERLRALDQPERELAPIVLSAVDPAQPYGGALRWPARSGESRSPARMAGAYVVLDRGEPIVYLERSGRGLQTLVEPDDERLAAAVGALVEHVRSGRIRRLALDKVNGESALSSPLGPLLIELGFSEGPRRLMLSA
jgi:ATP-dependent Lhr-like helicase